MRAHNQFSLFPILGKVLAASAVVAAACAVAALIYYFEFSGGAPYAAKKQEAGNASDTAQTTASAASETVDLTPNQLEAIKIEPVFTHSFRMEVEAVGSVVYHEKETGQDLTPAKRGAKFIVANIRESDSMLVHMDQAVKARLSAYPGREFEGKITTLGVTVYDSGGNPAIDPNTHRTTARCEIDDPKNELYPGMLANITIELQAPVESVAIPQSGVVREGDGTMTAWVTKDRHSFTRRAVKIGLQQDGFDQVLDGLATEELVATEGAVFISNILNALPSE